MAHGENRIDQSDVISANREYYNSVADEYLQHESYAYTDDIISDVKGLLRKGKGLASDDKQFLDVGCGSGFLSGLVVDAALFESGEGIDISERQVELYNKKLNTLNFSAKVGDVAKMSFNDEAFDMAGGYSVLHHFYDYFEVLDEVTRVLKPGGVLYFDFEPNRSFKKLMELPISLRKKFLDRAPKGMDYTESVAEFHNNFAPGIDINELISYLSHRYEIIEFGGRFPGTVAGSILKQLSKLSFSFSPCFYLLARKK